MLLVVTVVGRLCFAFATQVLAPRSQRWCRILNNVGHTMPTTVDELCRWHAYALRISVRLRRHTHVCLSGVSACGPRPLELFACQVPGLVMVVLAGASLLDRYGSMCTRYPCAQRCDVPCSARHGTRTRHAGRWGTLYPVRRKKAGTCTWRATALAYVPPRPQFNTTAHSTRARATSSHCIQHHHSSRVATICKSSQ